MPLTNEQIAGLPPRSTPQQKNVQGTAPVYLTAVSAAGAPNTLGRLILNQKADYPELAKFSDEEQALRAITGVIVKPDADVSIGNLKSDGVTVGADKTVAADEVHYVPAVEDWRSYVQGTAVLAITVIVES